jgi:hypothetical protein
MFRKESLVEKVSGTICLSCEVTIAQKIFYFEFMQSFLFMILFLVLVVERETRIQLFALVDKSLIERKCS